MNLPQRFSKRLAALLCAVLLLTSGGAPTALAQSPNALPALGDAASDDLSVGAERQIGDQIMRIIRRDPDYLDDPVLLEYLQSLWQPLLAAARARGDIGAEIDLRYPFEPFLVRERSVNAFALPGGYVGVHLGLIAMTVSRDELASVLAHELSHVTQRHIARSVATSKRASLIGVVSTILGVLAASRGGAGSADAANAAIAGGQAAAQQTQLNFSRDMEREADRVGSGVLTQAGFTAAGMAQMFEKLDKASRLNDSGNYPYLRSHPLTVERIGEARSRMGVNGSTTYTGSVLEHAIAQARARVLMDTRAEALRRLQELDANAARTVAAAGSAPRERDAKVEQLPDVLVFGIGSVAERLGAAYASALASTMLADWARADAALAIALGLAQGSPRSDDRALRAVRLLGAQSMVERGDFDRARAYLAPLGGDGSRPVLLLQAEIALGAYAQANALGNAQAATLGPLAIPALQRSADALQTWVAAHTNDPLAWKALGQVWARLGQPLRALRADAEAQAALGDLPGAIERLRAGQRLARSGGSADFIEASVIDARLRDLEAQRRAILLDEKKNGGPQG